MIIDPELLAIMQCPSCGGGLTERGGTDNEPPELECDVCGLRYPVKDGIPWMLVDEARRP